MRFTTGKKLLFLILLSLSLLNCQSQGQEEEQRVEGPRSNASLSSPYVDIGTDDRFPLLVRVWVNVDASHTAKVQNNDSDFPLSYDRAVSDEGFIPIVGLEFGDNSFDLEIRDNNSKVVAEHSLTAEIEDRENIYSWLTVEQASSSNDFSSVHLYAGTPWGKPIDSKYRLVVDDFGKIRWVHRWSGETNRGRSGYVMLSNSIGNKIYILDDEGIRIFSVDVFGNRVLVFDGEKFSEKQDYKVHHDFVITNKETLLALADPIEKALRPPDNPPEIFSVEDTIIEVDLTTGKLMREIDLKKIFTTISQGRPRLEDVAKSDYSQRDWMHLNAIHYDSESNSIILSGRNQSAVFALDYTTGTLKWLFADPENWQNLEVSSSLITAPNDYRYHKGQHDVRLDGNHLRFFDNSVLIIQDDEENNILAPDTSSRIVEATLDLDNDQVTSVKTYEPKVIFSQITGGFHFRDDNDNYLICYCGILRNSKGDYPVNFSEVIAEGQIFEIDEGDNDQTLLHFRVRGVSYRARYFDWEEMVE